MDAGMGDLRSSCTALPEWPKDLVTETTNTGANGEENRRLRGDIEIARPRRCTKVNYETDMRLAMMRTSGTCCRKIR